MIHIVLLLCFVSVITCGLGAVFTASASDYPPEDSRPELDLTLVISSFLTRTHTHELLIRRFLAAYLKRGSLGLISIQALTSSSDNDNDAHLWRRAAIHRDRFSSSNCLMVQCSMRFFITRGVHPRTFPARFNHRAPTLGYGPNEHDSH